MITLTSTQQSSVSLRDLRVFDLKRRSRYLYVWESETLDVLIRIHGHQAQIEQILPKQTATC